MRYRLPSGFKPSIWQQAVCRVWLFLGLAAWLLCGQSARAQDHIVERAWLEDSTGQLRWQDAQTLSTQLFDGVLSRGFGDSVVWLRLRVDPQAHAAPLHDPDRLVLRIRPVYLDDIQLFDPLVPGGLAGVTGDMHQPHRQAFEGLDFMLPIARGNTPRDIWLRLSSTSTRQISVQALNTDDLYRQTQKQQLMFALYVAMILVMVVWGLVYWLFSREPVIGVFGLGQAAALCYALFSLGYVRAFWPAQWPAQWLNGTTSLFSMVAVSAAILFHVVLIREFDPPRWAVLLHRGLLGLLPLTLLLFFVAHQPVLALQINMYEVLLAPISFLASAWRARGWSNPQAAHRPSLSRPMVLGFYMLLLLILSAAALPGLALFGGGETSLYVVQAHGLVTGFLVLLMLQYRAHNIQKQQNLTMLELERAQLHALQERKIHEEQGKLLAMLAHELKTPLATMHMRLDVSAQGSHEIRQAIRDMNNVIERCLQAAQTGDRQLTAHPEPLDLVDTVREAVSSCKNPERVQLDLPARMPLHTDRQLLFIVLNNLLENACKYAAPQTPIHVRLARTAGTAHHLAQVQLDITNQPGPAGWPEAEKVFNKYYRSPHARRQAGTGLGLFLARNLVQILQGHLAYAPDEQQVRFVLRLPFNFESSPNP